MLNGHLNMVRKVDVKLGCIREIMMGEGNEQPPLC